MFSVNNAFSPAYELELGEKTGLIISEIGNSTYMVAEPVDDGVIRDMNVILSHNDLSSEGVGCNRDYLILSNTVIYIDNLEDDLKTKLGIELDMESSKYWEQKAEFI